MSSPATYESGDNAFGFRQEARYSGPERRRNPRVPIHWTLCLVCTASERSFQTKTRDISPEGLYCVLDGWIEPGERLECDIAVPAHDLKDPKEVVHLRCRVQAVRVERRPGGGEFGLACRIEDYCVIRGWGEAWQLPRDSTTTLTAATAAP